MLMRTWKTEPCIWIDESRPVNAAFSNPDANIPLRIIINEGTGSCKPVVYLWLAPNPQKLTQTPHIENTMTPTLQLSTTLS